MEVTALADRHHRPIHHFCILKQDLHTVFGEEGAR